MKVYRISFKNDCLKNGKVYTAQIESESPDSAREKFYRQYRSFCKITSIEEIK